MAIADPLLHEALADDEELDVAPLDWNDFTPEQRMDIEQGLADLASGRARLFPHAEVQQALAEMRRQRGG